MGMFDYIRCLAPLPGSPPAFVTPAHLFQTKTFDGPWMRIFTITEDGRLVHEDDPGGEDSPPHEPTVVEYHGDVEFYIGNGHGARDGFWFTLSGEDYEFVEYRARFTHGRLESISEIERKRHPAKPIAEFWNA